MPLVQALFDTITSEMDLEEKCSHIDTLMNVSNILAAKDRFKDLRIDLEATRYWDVKNMRGYRQPLTAAAIAVDLNELRILKKLISYGADVTLAHCIAIYNDNYELTKYLLLKGSDIYAETELDGKILTPLAAAELMDEQSGSRKIIFSMHHICNFIAACEIKDSYAVHVHFNAAYNSDTSFLISYLAALVKNVYENHSESHYPYLRVLMLLTIQRCDFENIRDHVGYELFVRRVLPYLSEYNPLDSNKSDHKLFHSEEERTRLLAPFFESGVTYHELTRYRHADTLESESEAMSQLSASMTQQNTMRTNMHKDSPTPTTMGIFIARAGTGPVHHHSLTTKLFVGEEGADQPERADNDILARYDQNDEQSMGNYANSSY